MLVIYAMMKWQSDDDRADRDSGDELEVKKISLPVDNVEPFSFLSDIHIVWIMMLQWLFKVKS